MGETNGPFGTDATIIELVPAAAPAAANIGATPSPVAAFGALRRESQMELSPEGSREILLLDQVDRPIKTARRTQHCLVAAKLGFVFSHGLLAISASASLGSGRNQPWWAIFIPAWCGDALAAALCIYSWFASCPYIQLCFSERQARIGDDNPSILTELLPDIVWGLLGLIFVILAFVSEVLLCKYLNAAEADGKRVSLWPGGIMLIVVSLLAFCRGICVRTNGEQYGFSGLGVLCTTTVALCSPEGVSIYWLTFLPAHVVVLCMIAFALRRLRHHRIVLTAMEQSLQKAEIAVLGSVFLALLILVTGISEDSSNRARLNTAGAFGGVTAGIGVCILAALETGKTLLEMKHEPANERLNMHLTCPLRSRPESISYAQSDDSPTPAPI